ncbi:16S rRNA (cytidine(1402)-2'-O)-methyltransferase [Anoxybacillus ayderensis]|uniref:16S rRNA (cytidine(1402)-2'-O)-methyltransferase n=1 Tax=Anoxybacillus ayderensis TaxID=265546 RepID=UPI000A270D12|nr:16S rRNA (cytidine(1402)-2'-O)-methyltransferase [Anoxybacillus ayderensis]MED0657749.1 16S rRNA (cytidine(1402)-2'-O)-methyltransferase [Anoxybacillus ayderensis]OSX54183.1 16S rRNA (cytidine(1402)-2'-O)-methyltransferase [Anoxybacillus ayderensis]
MNEQKSFIEEDEKGILYIVPTPIGNLEDITLRAIETLRTVDFIAAEDTRQTKKLLNHFDIHTPLVSYHEHNKQSRGEHIIASLLQGKHIALVSDAGTPTISDPGHELVVEALRAQCKVVPLPGANAAITALTASGLPTNHFYFYGFLSRHKKEKKKELEQLKHIKDTLIFYEAPHRLQETLTVMYHIFGNRQMAVARELTKKFEQFIRGTIEEVMHWAEHHEVRGEFCLLVEGNHIHDEEPIWWNDLTIVEHVNYYIEAKQYTSKEAIKQVAKDRQLPKRDVYEAYHK